MKRRSLLHIGSAGILAAVGPWALANAADDFQTAIIRDNYLQVRQLLAQGMDPNTVDARGRPALVKALQHESLRVAQELLKAPGIRINDVSAQGETALMLACIQGRLDLVKQLLSMDARINQPGWAPLHYAVSANHEHSLEILQLLLDEHAYVDAESPNKSTPLMLAAQYGSQDMVVTLLNAGADVELRNQQNLSAIDFARRSERQFLVQLLEDVYRTRRRVKPSW